MIRDLAGTAGDVRRHADVLVVGAGIAGLIAADRLARAGLKVVVLESGGLSQDSNTHPLNRVEQTGHLYRGAEHGRFRCLGGTSTRWGGELIPFLAGDLDGHPAGWAPAWGVDHAELLSRLPELEALFGVPAGPYDAPSEVASEVSPPPVVPRLAKLPGFRQRNVAALLNARLAGAAGPEIWLNASLTELTVDPAAGRVIGGLARSLSGQTIAVEAPHVVVAAGAIESTRLLLLLDRQCDGRIFGADDVLGRYFFDHLSAYAGEITPISRAGLVKLGCYRFARGGMRSLRLELAMTERLDHNLPAAFAQVVFATDGPSGFDAVREILHAVQRRRLPPAQEVVRVAASPGWFARAAWWRYVRHRLLPPDAARFALNLVTEQEPSATNRITLSPNEKDPFDLPLARIHWTVSDSDVVAFGRISNILQRYWSHSTFGRLGRLELFDPVVYAEALQQGGGVYHPGGSTRIGRSPAEGVLDSALRAWRVPNLRVVATSAFPVGGAENPTLMLMLFGLHAADAIVAMHRRGER